MEEHNARLLLTHVCWVICLTFLAVLSELIVGDLGFLCPGAFMLSFYLTVAYGWRLGLVVGCLALVIVEIILGRSGTLLPVMLLIVGSGRFWKSSGDSSTLFSQLFPGAYLGALYAVSAVVVENAVVQPPGLSISVPAMGVHMIKSLVLGAVLLPLVVMLADWFAERLEINLYHRQSPRAKRKG